MDIKGGHYSAVVDINTSGHQHSTFVYSINGRVLPQIYSEMYYVSYLTAEKQVGKYIGKLHNR